MVINLAGLVQQKKKEEKLIDNIKSYTQLGFKHIIPKGLDHILFVLALFLLSSRLKPLILQVSIFTLAHTITLFLGVLDIIKIPSIIVEPIIALSICFIAIENLFTENLKKMRPYIIFIFGLLHGLGFAGVLNEIGISDSLFISSLISFNIGVFSSTSYFFTTGFSIEGYNNFNNNKNVFICLHNVFSRESIFSNFENLGIP